MVISVCHATCRGARHLSRGEPCQDASASSSGVAADGTPYGLLVVADGHGHPRHSRSGVGAMLACTLAQQLAVARLEQPGSTGQSWPAWFKDGFPAMLVDAWRRGVDVHAQQHHGESQADPISYGTTLGLALLTPQCWLCAGIGDWDLVVMSRGGTDLASQEQSEFTPGESTFSLCQSEPLGPMAQRFTMGQLRGEKAEIVLCTDGVRKSCRNDNDFLSLCRHLSTESGPTDSLAAMLQTITNLGSGDDVSAALACIGEDAPNQPRVSWP